MSAKTFASLFTGFGLADRGAIMAGLQPIWGIEYIPELGNWGAEQNGHTVHIMNLLDADPADFETPDFLHMSPPCPSFSTANQNKGETANDIDLANKCAEFIRVMQPDYFTLENVYGYRKSQSWKIIANAINLIYGAFSVSVDHLNFADLGVPQSRKRMIVRAVKNGFIRPIELTHKDNHVGWYEAVEDIMHTFEPSQLANWQIERQEDKGWMPDKKDRGYILNSTDKRESSRWIPRDQDQPAITVRPTGMQKILISGGNKQNEKFAKQAHGPSFAIVSQMARSPLRIVLEDWSVIGTAPYGDARFMTLPDDYELPEKKTLAMTGLGNGVPCLGMQRIIESML